MKTWYEKARGVFTLKKNETIRRMMEQAIRLGAVQVFEFNFSDPEKIPDFLHSQPGFDPNRRSVCCLCGIPDLSEEGLLAMCRSLLPFLAFGSSIIFSLERFTPELPVSLGELDLLLYEEENQVLLAVRR